MKRHDWKIPIETMRQLDRDGLLYITQNERIRAKRYLDESPGRLIGPVWSDIPPLVSTDSQRTGYPTQKPLRLLQRMVGASTDPGDTVLDPMCGSGTTIEAAGRMGRHAIGIDSQPMARIRILVALPLIPLAAVLGGPLEDLNALRVEPEGAQCHDRPYRDYSAEYRAYESDIGPNGLENRIVRAQRGIYSPYDDRSYDSITETDIEHIVAREQAHVSGLCTATKSARVAYVHDIGNLTLATPQVNRELKGKLDFGLWRPDHNRCWMAAAIIETKRVWGLSVDPREKAALANQVHLCTSFEMHLGRLEQPP